MIRTNEIWDWNSSCRDIKQKKNHSSGNVESYPWKENTTRDLLSVLMFLPGKEIQENFTFSLGKWEYARKLRDFGRSVVSRSQTQMGIRMTWKACENADSSKSIPLLQLCTLWSTTPHSLPSILIPASASGKHFLVCGHRSRYRSRIFQIWNKFSNQRKPQSLILSREDDYFIKLFLFSTLVHF